MAEKKVTKSEFLRKQLEKKPDLEHDQINRRWAKAGHPGEISKPLYYKVRSDLGIKSVWSWGPAPGAAAAAPAGAAKNPSAPAGTSEIYRFKITLLDTEPAIWRELQVADSSLNQFHELIQTAMGWTNSHMHHFIVDQTLYGNPNFLQETFEELRYEDSTATMLSDILPKGDKPFRFKYEYDFGDGWMHEIRFEGRPESTESRQAPACLAGERACPPEDVGGAWGYVDFLEAIADRHHERYEELREWLGRKFNPDAFNPKAATKRMQRG